MIAGSVVNLILNILFIPVLGAKGAVIGQLARKPLLPCCLCTLMKGT